MHNSNADDGALQRGVCPSPLSPPPRPTKTNHKDHDLEIKLRKVEAFLDDGLRCALPLRA
jgi:hypothetical protein